MKKWRKEWRKEWQKESHDESQGESHGELDIPGGRKAAQEPNFDRVANVYRWAEYLALGPLLEQTRESFLPELLTRRLALVLGDGDGRFTAKLLEMNREVKVLAVDTSAKMLELLRGRCRHHAARLETEQQTALVAGAHGGTDLIVTHFLLDCFEQTDVVTLVARLAGETQAGTLWLLSDFAVPAKGWLRPLAKLYVRLLYWAFARLTGLRVQRLPDPQRAMAAAGFGYIARHERVCGLLYTELWVRLN